MSAGLHSLLRPSLLLLLTGSVSLAIQERAATEPLDSIGEPFYSKRIEIVWNLRTNPLPDMIRLFEVQPASVSPSAVSNLLTVSGLSTNDLTAPAAKPPAPLLFRKGDSWLTIDPENGHLEYYTIERGRMWPTNVPDQVRATELATNLSARLEIPLSEFITGTSDQPRAWFYPGTMGRFDKEKREFIQAPCRLGVEFRRQLDGIPCLLEHLHMQFESQEKLTHLDVHWHELKPSPSFTIATTDQIAEWIREGRARVQSLEVAGPGGRRIQPADIRRISIEEIALHYTGATYYKRHAFKEKSARCLYPYAVLTAEAEISPDDREVIFLFAPVTAQALTSISRTHDRYGFAIYPSRRFGPPATGN